MTPTLAVALVLLGAALVVVATSARRSRWRAAQPFAGDERAAPEDALVPRSAVYAVYLGWLLVGAGALVLAVSFAD
jgi:hypothetical protein